MLVSVSIIMLVSMLVSMLMYVYVFVSGKRVFSR
jgi:hypothetical protein